MRTKIWASLSAETPMGVLLWEIFEVDMENNKVDPSSNFTACRDGSFIMITCNHFWTQEAARRPIRDDYTYSKYFDYELVGEK